MQMLPYRRHHEPEPTELASFRSQREASSVSRLLVHSRFVPSLASSDESRRARSAALLSRELGLAQALGAEAYVIHGGAYSPAGEFQEGVRLFTEGIARARQESGARLPILVENVPGGGRRMGGTLEELCEILNKVRGIDPQVGLCLDTAHAWAAGYEIASAEGMLRFLARAHRILGAENILAFHLNDTRSLLGSHREHHDHWGRGFLGAEGLKALLQRPEYEGALGILETPRGDLDRNNLDYVLRLA